MFCPNTTFILVSKGQTRPITDLWIGDQLVDGKVKSVKRHAQTDDTLYVYDGVRVAGKTPVWEGNEWIMVRESTRATPLIRGAVCSSFETDSHRIYILNRHGRVIEFGDSFLYGIKPELLNKENM